MIKKIVFDLDNTLIMWNDEYWNSLNKTLEKLNIKYDNNIILKLREAVDNYENEYNIYNKQYMKECMEKHTKIDLPNNFIDTWIEYLKECVPTNLEEGLIETLDYLKNKYELVVLTNWFTDQQKERLKNTNILSYFDEVIGTDNVLNKPNKEPFIKACYPYELNECIMIGDNLNVEIIPALNIGMNVILFDYKNKYNGNIKKITQIKELKNIL